MKNIVFICRGNIFRSQIAKAIYNFLKIENSVAFAYGTNVAKQGREGLLLDSYPGFSVLISVMKNHGIDITGQHCVQLLPEHLSNAYKIIVMTEKEDIPEWLKSYDYEYWDMPNPEAVPPEVAEKEFNLLNDKIRELIKTV